MHSLAHYFISLIKQVCAKGYITNEEIEIICIVGAEKLNWSKEQIQNLLEIQLHPGIGAKYNFNELIENINEAGAGLKLEEDKLKNLRKSLPQKLRLEDWKEEVNIPDEIKKIIYYQDLHSKLSNLSYFVDLKWHSATNNSTPAVKEMFAKVVSGNFVKVSFYRIVNEFFINSKYLDNYEGVGKRKIENIIELASGVVDFANRLISSQTQLERAIIIFDLDLESDKVWLKNYFQNKNQFPLFWLLRSFILTSLPDREGQIYLNAISNSPFKIRDIAEAYDLAPQRIEQILEKLDDKLDLVLDKFLNILKQIGQLEKLLEDGRMYMNNPSNSIALINKEQSLNFTENFLKVFLAKLFKEEYQIIGTPKLLVAHLFEYIKHEKHRWQNLYLVQKTIAKREIQHVISYFDNLCSINFNNKNVEIDDGIKKYLSNSTILSIISQEGLTWEVKRMVRGRFEKHYTETRFQIGEGFQLTWLEKKDKLYEKEERVLRRVFYELELNRPMSGKEIVNKYSRLNEDCELDANRIVKHKEELSIVSIADKWMTIDCAKRSFHPDILSLKKISYRDAIFYHIKKDVYMQGKTRSEWVLRLNQVLNHNYEGGNIQSIADDERFVLIDTVINGKRSQLIYLSNNGMLTND